MQYGNHYTQEVPAYGNYPSRYIDNLYLYSLLIIAKQFMAHSLLIARDRVLRNFWHEPRHVVSLEQM